MAINILDAYALTWVKINPIKLNLLELNGSFLNMWISVLDWIYCSYTVSESEEISVPTRILRGHNSPTYFVGIFWFESVTSPWAGFELTTLVVIGTDCIGSCKFNYPTITTTTMTALSADRHVANHYTTDSVQPVCSRNQMFVIYHFCTNFHKTITLTR